MGWWLASYWQIGGAVLVFSWVVWVIGSIILHELAHGWAAIRLGDRTPIETGHMTWSPLVHMGPTSLIAFLVRGFTWGLMPVNPARLRGRHGDAVVAAAGPAMNACLAVLCLVLYGLWLGFAGGYWIRGVSVADDLYANTQMFFRVGIAINILGVLFNLIPVPPLDGSRILASFVPRYATLWEGERGGAMGLMVFLGVFFIGSKYVWTAVFEATTALTSAVAQAIATP